MIEIVPYDRNWPAQFEAEAKSIGVALASVALRIEHVGSTAVPGLAAKPVIDIQVSVGALDPLAMYLERLGQIGYVHFPLGEFDSVYPFFQKPGSWPGTHHIHLCVVGGEQERRHLAFRDYLRCHPAACADYERLKRSLAAVHDGNTLDSLERYSLSKTEFVTSVLKLASLAGSPATGP